MCCLSKIRRCCDDSLLFVYSSWRECDSLKGEHVIGCSSNSCAWPQRRQSPGFDSQVMPEWIQAAWDTLVCQVHWSNVIWYNEHQFDEVLFSLETLTGNRGVGWTEDGGRFSPLPIPTISTEKESCPLPLPAILWDTINHHTSHY